MLRKRWCQPPPQLLVQLVHSLQGSMPQSLGASCTLGNSARVSSNEPLHGAPPLRGIAVTTRLRVFCISETSRLLGKAQSLHEENWQSRLPQCVGSQCFVSSRALLHGSPHSLFMVPMSRRLSQRPPQPILSTQSVQGVKLQCTGMHSSGQGLNGKHCCTVDSEPRQVALPSGPII
jgi:hypothetical protein